MNFPDLMIDLETLGTGSGAAVVQIGVCQFGPDGVANPVTYNVTLESAMAAGDVDASTLEWWLQQPLLRTVMLGGERIDLKEALGLLRLHTKGAERVWGHGPQFDLVILRNAYRATGAGGVPWGYRAERCMRTIMALSPESWLPRDEARYPKHDAGADAAYQAECVRDALMRLCGGVRRDLLS